MARALFIDTIGLAEADAAGKPVYRPLSNVDIYVYLPGTTTTATIYQSRTGASQKSNPFTTIEGGSVEFWAEAGEYDIKFQDKNTPQRIGNKTIGWSAVSAAVGGTPSNILAADGGIPYGALGAVAQRQDTPIGGVIAWWRPVSTVTVPTGWAICDGSTVAAGSHDFTSGGSIVLPDLRNAFILGANAAVADSTNGGVSDLVGQAPGIRGQGGGNVKDTAHAHTIAAHTHSVSSAGSHTHGVVVTGNTGNASSTGAAVNPGLETAIRLGHTHPFTGGGATDANGTHSHTLSQEGLTTSTAGTTTLDGRPKYVGLLYIMKVKRN